MTRAAKAEGLKWRVELGGGKNVLLGTLEGNKWELDGYLICSEVYNSKLTTNVLPSCQWYRNVI